MKFKNWNIVCWNIRGMNSENKLLAIRNCIDTSGCDILCLQETKRQDFDLAYIKTFCPIRLDKFSFVPSRGASGGLITIWNSSMFSGTQITPNFYSQQLSHRSTQSDQSWTLVNIYGYTQGIMN